MDELDISLLGNFFLMAIQKIKSENREKQLERT